MKRIILATVLALVPIFFIQCKKGEDYSLKACSIIGEVAVISATGEKALKAGDRVTEGDTVKTSKLSIADLVMGDSVLIRIHENSIVRMSALLSDTNENTRLLMDKGKMYVTLSRIKKGSFSVKMPTSVASVRGTAFRVSADNSASRLEVMQGTVTVNPVKDSVVVEDVEKKVEANQSAEIEKKAVDAIITKKEIEVLPMKPEAVKEIQAEIQDIKPEVLEKLNPEVKKEFKKNLSDTGKDKETEREPIKKSEPVKKTIQNKPVPIKEPAVRENKNQTAPEKKEKGGTDSTPANIQTL